MLLLNGFCDTIIIENITNGKYTSNQLFELINTLTSKISKMSKSDSAYKTAKKKLSSIYREIINCDSIETSKFREQVKEQIKSMYKNDSVTDDDIMKSLFGLLYESKLNQGNYYSHLSERNQILFIAAKNLSDAEFNIVSKTPVYSHNIDGYIINFYACDEAHAKLYAMKLEKVYAMIPDCNFKKLLFKLII